MRSSKSIWQSCRRAFGRASGCDLVVVARLEARAYLDLKCPAPRGERVVRATNARPSHDLLDWDHFGPLERWGTAAAQ
jgi:hypothetical protein